MIPGDTVRTYAGISFYIRINHSIIREQSWNTLLYNYLFFHIFLVYRQTDRTQLSHTQQVDIMYWYTPTYIGKRSLNILKK